MGDLSNYIRNIREQTELLQDGHYKITPDNYYTLWNLANKYVKEWEQQSGKDYQEYCDEQEKG